jgi:hypothetical protein
MRRLFLFGVAVLAVMTHVFADVPGTKISVVGSNAIVSWPSRTGETFVVLYRATLHTNTPWSTLAAHRVAAVNTNWTSFTHTNGVLYPAPCPGNTNGTAEGPPAPGGASLLSSEVGQRELYTWEREDRPPFPWDPEFTKGSSYLLAASSMQASLSSLESECEPPTLGFYRVFRTSPLANADFFSIQQDSGANQFSIFDNDSDPDDDAFLLSNVSSAGHGTLNYTDNASTFTYTPDSGFSRTDSFTYTITNSVGGRATATTTVFVSVSGNNPPVATGPVVTLVTNVYTATVNPLAGVTDPDSDTVSFVAVTRPALGSVTNVSGQLVYTHPSNYFGSDSFDYYLTDGRGGLTRVPVLVLQADGENDAIADQWELRFGFDPTQNDAYADPDSDGLPNLAEYKLGTHPRLADNPLNLDNVSVGQAISNYARIPIALGAAIQKPTVSLLMNGDTAGGFLQQGADGTWYFNWDTGYLTNGNYTIAASFQFNPDAQPPTPGVVVGQNKTVRLTNDVIWQQINSEFSDVLYINLTFPYQNAEWRIEFYDEDGSGLVYFDGTTTDGNVQGSWDLTDTGAGGQQIAFGSILAEVYVIQATGGQGGGGAALPPPGSGNPNSRRWFAKQIPGGIGDTFVIAWGWDSYGSTFTQARENLMMDGVVNILGNPAFDDEYTLRPASNIPFGGAFRFDTGDDRTILMDALKAGDSGNFFWFGHGDRSTIQGNAKKASIISGDVENELKNKKHRSKPPKIVRKNEHPYRLVILNGCETYSAEWANAFGIDYSPNTSTNSLLMHLVQGREPQAFVGWKDGIEVPAIADFTMHNQYALALADLFVSWMGGSSIQSCLEDYAEQMDSFDFEFHDSWRISGCFNLTRP